MINCAALSLAQHTDTRTLKRRDLRNVLLVTCFSSPRLTLYSLHYKINSTSTKENKRFQRLQIPWNIYWRASSVRWNGLKNKGRKTLCVSRAGHGRAHVTIIDVLTLQFTTPAVCPCAGHRALKKTSSMFLSQSISPWRWHWFADSWHPWLWEGERSLQLSFC